MSKYHFPLSTLFLQGFTHFCSTHLMPVLLLIHMPLFPSQTALWAANHTALGCKLWGFWVCTAKYPETGFTPPNIIGFWFGLIVHTGFQKLRVALPNLHTTGFLPLMYILCFPSYNAAATLKGDSRDPWVSQWIQAACLLVRDIIYS